MAVYNHQGVSPAGRVAEVAVVKDRLVMSGTVANTVTPSTGITSIHVGVAERAAAVGDTVSIQQFGKCRGVASAAITLGDKLMWATGGKVATLSGATATVVGIALTAATADGDVIEFDGRFPALHDTQ